MKDKIINTIKESYAGIFISLCLSFMLLFYEPLNIFANNLGDFWFDIYTFFPVVICQFIISFLVLSLFFIIMRKIHKNVYIFFVVVALIGTICTYVQGNFLAGSLPAIDGNWIDWDTYKTEKLISIILWLVVAASIIFVLYKFKFSKIEKVSMYASLVIIAMLASSIFGIVTVKGFFDKRNPIVATTENINNMSSDKNFIIFLLDAVDSKTFNTQLEKTGKTKTIFKDFTYYPDTLAVYPFTKNSIPFILGGKWYENERDFDDYLADDLDNSPFLEKLEDNDYALNLYDYELNDYYKINYSRFDNLEKNDSLDPISFFVEESKLILYKYLPYQLKWRSRIDTLKFSAARKVINQEHYDGNNIKNYERIKDDKFNIVEGNNFQFIHIEGAHVPYVYNANVERINQADGTYDGNVDACITIVEAYLNKLRENDVYDNSVIVIMTDHGYNIYGLLGRQNPILYIKGINEKHEYQVSDKKISYTNLIDAFNQLIDGDKTDKIFENLNNEERRYLLYVFTTPEKMTEMLTKGKAWETEKMYETGKIFELEP